jgi:hypothetical protein
MQELKINTWLICITVQASQEQWAQVFKFLEWKKKTVKELLCITTSGRKDYQKLGEIRDALYEKFPNHKSFGLMSKPLPDIPATYVRLEMALSFENRDNGVLLISEVPIEELFKPIQTNLLFGDEDLFEDGKDNNDYLAEFVLSVRSIPDLMIYDCQTMQFVK